MSKMKKPTPAQLKVLQKMNEGWEIYYNKSHQETTEYFKKGNLIFEGFVNLHTFKSLLKQKLISIFGIDGGQYYLYYQISELGKQALNEQNEEA